MSGINNNPLLSICIPTWNRGSFLKASLQRIYNDYQHIDKSEVELLVSDNCSEDNTSDIVKEFQERGLPIIYNRNIENIGAAKNFLMCMHFAQGKYILLLGDDDYFCENGLRFILNKIRGKEYGLIHICKYLNEDQNCWIFSDKESFLKRISFWVTFMSGNIFRKEIVNQINEPERYISSHLLQMPFFITSALSQKENLVINNKGLMQVGVDYKNNGGYNVYEVFVKSYLNIWKEFVDKKDISQKCYSFIMKDLYMRFILDFNIELLILKKNIADESMEYLKSRHGYKIANAKHILYHYYKKKPYYYYSAFIVMWRGFMMFLKGLTKIYLRRDT